MSDELSQKLIDGWLGELRLNFALRGGRSVLTKCKHVGPFYVKKVFYSEHDNTPHVYLLHPPGGLVGGDKLVLDVKLESGSRALLTTPGATKFYRSNGMYAEQKHTFRLECNTALEWVPQSSIFFPKSKVKIDTTFIIEQGSRIISFDMLCFGNLSLGTSNYPEEVDIHLKICLSDSIGLQERLRINELNCVMKLGGFRISALLFAVPSDEKILYEVRKLITSVKHFQVGGATLLDEILVVRLLGNDNQYLKKMLHHIWCTIRPFIIGRKAMLPRIWMT
ncbi:urease accessory protein UreD [Candidatus Blochmanniella camponoti]|uniref:Urease accessory protein UreD n=1 Tax=Candidatus Blochmanniella camponoti TaxID=108080 RepID=A0AAE9L517_9ENTR|nr:urease accessory protein UreD [Candidatus Blochmannia herculeanus]URJ24359.1 urease accessory protein UreD [Candidatus Blochmannia herculeanus]URJ27713.1 urease accessory protein UreD [Candidatus Blochmannia herculeanus]